MGAFQAGLVLLRIEDYARAEELSGVDVLVLATLLSFAADHGRPVVFASVPRIAARSRLSRSTIQRSLDHMERVGVIAGEHRHRRPTRWSFDLHFTKAGSASVTPAIAGPASVSATPTSVTETPAKRQSDAQQASERRSAGVTVTLQGTEVGSGAKRRNPTDVLVGCASDGGSAALAAASAPPPHEPAPWRPGPPPGTRLYVDGVEIKARVGKP